MTTQYIVCQSQVDVAPANVESQPLPVETQFSLSLDFQMEELDLLYNFPKPNSPSLHLEEPTSQTDGHLLQDLLDHEPILQDTIRESVALSKSLTTDFIIVSTNTSIVIPSSSSIDIIHQLLSAVPSTTGLNSSQPLIDDNVPSTADPQLLI